MWVTGYWVGDGMISWFLKVFQYLCSAVIGEGPEGSFSCGSGATSAAIATTEDCCRAVVAATYSRMYFGVGYKIGEFFLSTSQSRWPYPGYAYHGIASCRYHIVPHKWEPNCMKSSGAGLVELHGSWPVTDPGSCLE